MRFLAVFYFLFLSSTTIAISLDSEQADKIIRFTQKQCTETSPHVFILIDGSSKLTPSTIAWVKSQIFNIKSNIQKAVQPRGRMSTAYMDSRPVADMTIHTICRPKSLEQVDWLTESKQKYKNMHKIYSHLPEYIGHKFLSKTTSTNKSLIIESVREVFTNPIYNMLNVGGQRVFVLISDLYQHSPLINFFKICTKDRCPSYKDLIGKNERISKYLIAATPKMRKEDKVYLFNININGRTNQSARQFWQEYFQQAGVKVDNINFFQELANNSNSR